MLEASTEHLPTSPDNDPVIAGENWGDGRQQIGFLDDELDTGKKQPNWQDILCDAKAVLPRQHLIAWIKLHSASFRLNGCWPSDSRVAMLRILRLCQSSVPVVCASHLRRSSSLSDQAWEDPLIKAPSMRRLATLRGTLHPPMTQRFLRISSLPTNG
jgi:hypothetical protein